MEPVDEHLMARLDAYIENLFGLVDPLLDAALREAQEAGLPAIQVSPNQGKLLQLFARIAGARRILEIGTLGGCSLSAWPAPCPRAGSW